MTSHVGLAEARDVGERVLKGDVRGRVVDAFHEVLVPATAAGDR